MRCSRRSRPSSSSCFWRRTLFREGYDDHLAGHITIKQPDGTLLCNPWFLLWDEFTPDDVVRVDVDGSLLEGRWPYPPGVKLHFEVHKLRDDVNVAVHNHPHFATLWANARRIPPCLDQTSGLGGGKVALGQRVRRLRRQRRPCAHRGDRHR